MSLVGEALRQGGVAAIYLSHGTFAGDDPFGLSGELGRLFPTASDAVRRVIKDLVDAAAADVGNYTEKYTELFEHSINDCLPEPRITVKRFNWSSENNHIGRADGAIRLIDELHNLQLSAGQRVLLWGHSHAGNVFALMSNLLGADLEARQQFFDAAKVYYCWPVVGCVDIPLWRRMRELLLKGGNPLANTPLDLVTFGTPIRYGWNESGLSRLMHFINHRPVEGKPPYLAPFPPVLDRVLNAVDGDYVQQFGIAGTNFMPSVLSWRSWWADNKLNRLLQPSQESYDPRERFRTGARVPDTGETLLVDYGLPGGTIAQHFAGHAVYTRLDWLCFHAEEVTRRWYATVPRRTTG